MVPERHVQRATGWAASEETAKGRAGSQGCRRLWHQLAGPAPGRQPFPEPGFTEVVHKEPSFTHVSAVFFLPRCPPTCLSLQPGPGVRWPRSSPAASETNCAVSACAGARGREADVVRHRGARGGQSHPLTSASRQGSGVLDLGTADWGGGWEPVGGRLTEVRAACPCPALLYGDAEKPAESGGSQPPRATSRKAACACNQKPCSCPKAEVNYAFLHATGKGASRGPGSFCPSPCPVHRGQEGPGAGTSRWRAGADLRRISSRPRETLGLPPLSDPDPGLCVALGSGVPGGLRGRGALRPAPPSGLRVAEAPRRTLASGPILRAPEASVVM